ncbi:MAG: DUF3592 domain-containing protein [Pseudomonadota bacterium]
MKGRILLFLFALPFAGFGTWMLYSIGSELLAAADMRDWQPAQATLLSAGYKTHSGDDSNTYEAYASYTYRYAAQSYTGSRVGIADGADNIGDYQQDTGNRLSRALASNQPITVFVDPSQPAQSIIDPHPRWGLIAFKSVFVLLFGGVGYGLLIAGFLSPKAKDPEAAEYRDAPWLVNDAWQGGEIRSGAKSGMRGAWFFAGFWNLISMPLPFLLYGEITEKQNYAALLGLIFPVVGLGLLYWAIKLTREWRHFGVSPLTLDPFPGSIGGHVGGHIELNTPFDSTVDYELTLTNLHSRMTGSGKSRSRRESAKWQDRRIAHAEPGAKGTRLAFRFDVPEGLSESDASKQEDAYTIWRLSVVANVDGRQLDRNWELPVYPTAARSRNIDERHVEASRVEQAAVDERSVRQKIAVRHTASGKSLYYPMGRSAGSALIGMLVGGIFAGSGIYLLMAQGAWFMGGIFSLVGSLIALGCVYMIGNSLEVFQDGMHLHTKRRLFGIPARRNSMPRAAFSHFDRNKSMTTQSGGKHTIVYTISAVDASGHTLTLGEGFRGQSEADAATRLIALELGLPLPDQPSANDSDNDTLEYNALAADN